MKTLRRTSGFIRQFSGPGETSIVCFKFWQAIVASGCPGECAYCFLQTQTPYRRGLYDLKGTLFDNLPDIVSEARKWLRQSPPAGLIIGENQDGLAFEYPYKKLLGVTPLELLIPLFSNENPHGHMLVVLSKFTSSQYAEAFAPNPNVVFSWSLSLPSISRRYEKRVASLNARLKKARELRAAGWRIRFRLDALAPIPGWENDLHKILEEINSISPEMLTIGAMRATSVNRLREAAAANGRDPSIFDYVREKDRAGFKYRVDNEFHIQAFKRISRDLDPGIVLGLCKEDALMWQTIEAPWRGCHCLHGMCDAVVAERGTPQRLLEELQNRGL